MKIFGQDSPILNSDHIRATFGSYGVDVLREEPTYRISRLYSLHGGTKVTRTVAAVHYADDLDSRIRPEHHRILDGESIGEAFQENGWRVVKHHEFIGEFQASRALAKEFQLEDGKSVSLAVNAYALEIEHEDERLPYAWIAEIHHPDHLDIISLRRIYGDAACSRKTPETVRVLDLVREFGSQS